MSVFKRIRAIKQKLLHDHPELQAAAKEHDAKQEQELEARLELVQSSANQVVSRVSVMWVIPPRPVRRAG